MKLTTPRNKIDDIVNVTDLSSTFYLSTTLDPCIVQEVLDFTDEIIGDESSVDYSSYLAGEFETGQQIEVPKLKLDDPRMIDFSAAISTLSQSFVARYLSLLRLQYIPRFSCDINDMWINRQLAGDYNPPHRHFVRSNVGLSGVFYLKIPEQIKNVGSNDGCLQLLWGSQMRYDISQFTLPSTNIIHPHSGFLILFPHSLCHQAFTFQGKGERRCVPFNVNVWPSHGETWKL